MPSDPLSRSPAFATEPTSFGLRATSNIEIMRVDYLTGKVTLNPDFIKEEAAQEFWLAVQAAFKHLGHAASCPVKGLPIKCAECGRWIG